MGVSVLAVGSMQPSTRFGNLLPMVHASFDSLKTSILRHATLDARVFAE
jgi:hypothetical protein